MIFVTTGTQEPFDRLLKLIQQIAPNYSGKIVIQAKTEMTFHNANIELHEFLSPAEFKTFFDTADLIVSHAGMGSIISALNESKPLLIIPRKLTLKEHRNDHQMATAKKIKELNYVHVAMDDTELLEKLSELLRTPSLKPIFSIGSFASKGLLTSLESFIEG